MSEPRWQLFPRCDNCKFWDRKNRHANGRCPCLEGKMTFWTEADHVCRFHQLKSDPEASQ